MASITKRSWTRKDGTVSTVWCLRYRDAKGGQRSLQFSTKREAVEARIRIEGEMVSGLHVPARSSLTVGLACDQFLQDFERQVAAGLRERSTLKSYRSKIDCHIAGSPLASIRLGVLTAPDVRAWAKGIEGRLSPAQARAVMAALRIALGWAVEEGLATRNPARDVKLRAPTRARSMEEVEAAIPVKTEIKALIGAAEARAVAPDGDGGFAAAWISIGIFCGLRASELRGLPLTAINLKRRTLTVMQRADERGIIGPCKSTSGFRTVGLTDHTIAALKRWLPRVAPEHGLVFASSSGRPFDHSNLVDRFWVPLMAEAGLARPVKGADGSARLVASWSFHAMRHVAASLAIEQGMNPKQLQRFIGHASIQTTYDIYGHLFPDAQVDRAKLQAMQASILD